MTGIEAVLLDALHRYGGRCGHCGNTLDVQPHRRAIVNDTISKGEKGRAS